MSKHIAETAIAANIDALASLLRDITSRMAAHPFTALSESPGYPALRAGCARFLAAIAGNCRR
jgi:hypothetical protein